MTTTEIQPVTFDAKGYRIPRALTDDEKVRVDVIKAERRARKDAERAKEREIERNQPLAQTIGNLDRVAPKAKNERKRAAKRQFENQWER